MSAYKPLKFKITGVAPLLMHNGQTADPLNPPLLASHRRNYLQAEENRG
jgi:hypothetical protein